VEADDRERRRRLTHRALPALAALALPALGLGFALGAAFESDAERVAADFARTWERGDYATMQRLIAADRRARVPVEALRAAYERAAAVATSTSVRVGEPDGMRAGKVRVPVTVETRVFGTVRGEVLVGVAEGQYLDWQPHLVFPGLGEGETLARETKAPERARILSTRGKTLAAGPAENRSSAADAASIAGSLAPSEDAAERRELFARGFPPGTLVGANGLERALQAKLEGRPGGTLMAGDRVLARSPPRPAKPVRSTIDTGLQAAADTALAGRFGGIAVLDARTAEVRALAGLAFSAPQPPGSTFKLVTTTAALEHGLVTPGKKFPVQSEALIDGVPLQNANGELCGGTFSASFAHSCNSVFAPLGVKVGAKRLVATAESYGWNRPPEIRGAEPSTLPAAEEIASPLELGSSAIGQGKVLATPLQMASVAQTVAGDGVRAPPTLVSAPRPQGTRVASSSTARTIERLMIGVVGYGTGTAAAIPGVKVAGKTGTAELGDTRGADAVLSDPSNTDAWFTAYAPAADPEIAVAVLLIRNGAGGATAAPAAKEVLAAALAKD